MKNKKNMRKINRTATRRVLCILLCGVMCLVNDTVVRAVTKSELQKQQSATQGKLNKANQNISGLQDQKGEAQAEVDELDEQLVTLLGAMDILEGELKEKKAEIAQAESDYEVAKADEDTQYEAMKLRIKFMYEKGDTQYLELFMQSKSLADAINKADYAEKLYDYDRTLLINYQEIKDKVAALEEQLKTEQSELEAMQGEYEEQQTELQTTIDDKKSVVEDFDAKLSAAKAEARTYQAQIKAQNTQIAKIAAAEKAAKEKAEKAAKEKAAAAATAAAASGEAGESGGSSSSDSGSGGSSGGSATGRSIADYACNFIGNPYVAGGTSLTNGTDCSGFTMSVYAHFGYSIPRTSGSQLNYGTAVSYSDAEPGDIMCYAGHVGIYIGNGMIVHASTPATGIKTTIATYRPILSVRRIVK